MMNARYLAAMLALSLLIAGGFGCTDDPGSNSSDKTDNGRITDPVDAPDTAQLLHVSPDCTPGNTECLMNLTMGSALDVRAQLLDADGQPVENALITFEKNFAGSELSISSASAYTDADGVAKATVYAGESAGTGELTAKTDNAQVDPIKWHIGVSSKDAASYSVTFTHSGTAQIKPIAVRLFPATVTCEALASNPNQTAVLEREGMVDAANVFPTVVFPDRPNGDAYTVAAWASSLNNGAVEVAYGCTDNNPAIERGQSVSVVVALIDHMPNIVGNYDVIHDFDLVGALPENIQTVVNLIGRLANDPGSFIVGCPDNSTDPGCPSGSGGILDLLVGFLPDGGFKDAIEGFLNASFTNAIARDAINQIAENWLDNAPGWVGNTVHITGDIVDTLSHFRVEGTMRFTEAPVVSVDPDTGKIIGILPSGSGKQTWNDFVFRWRQGCDGTPDPDACAIRRMGSAQLGIQAVTGNFDGTLLGADQLQINQHTLTLNYGALLVAIIEKIVLPEIFGSTCGSSGNQPCDTLDAALGKLISCPGLAEKISGDTSGSVYNIVDNLCVSLLHQASDTLRDYAATKLVANGDDVFLIATPTDEHCTLLQPDVYQGNWPGQPYPYIQYLGQESPAELQCKWEAKIKFSESTTATVKGKFWGDRKE